MNPRIFKKLCKRASLALIKSGYVKHLDFITQDNDESPEICMNYNWELKSFYNKKLHPKWPTMYLNTLDGTQGFGAMSGYYELEWWDKSSLCMLREAVFDHFTDWENFDDGEMSWPKNKTPEKIRSSPINAIKFYESLKA